MGFSGLFSRKLVDEHLLAESQQELTHLSAVMIPQKFTIGTESTHAKGRRLATKNKRRVARASRQEQRRKAKGK